MVAVPGKKSREWLRLGCVTVSAVALFMVFRRVDPSALAAAFRNMHFGWLLAAIVLYGFIFLPGAWRWHLMLRLTDCAVHLAATARMSLIGHFFCTVLFGPADGDLANSALYARWYRLPLAKILVAIPLDRLLGFCGWAAFAGLAFGWAAITGVFSSDEIIVLRWSAGWAIGILALTVLWFATMLRRRSDSMWTKWLRALAAGGRLLISSSRVAAQGLLCGFLVQVAMSGVLACSLQAVSISPLPWDNLLWTLPVISVMSALPITVAGLGFREGAAMVLLGFYGIPAVDAVAASLLTLSVSLFWAAVGALLFWREGNLQSFRRAIPKSLSVVIPTLNEAESLTETVRRARAVPEICEIIVVDGGSSDRTREIAAQLGCRVFSSAPGRGGQMRLGAAQATGDIIVMLHADTWLPPQAGRAAINCFRDSRVVGGGFWKIFRHASPLLLGSRFKCAIRLYLGRRIAGDQTLFVRREVLEAVGNVPDMPLMEEFELCRRLRKVGRLSLADATIVTSARRFVKLGVVRTYLRMWRVSMQYRLGASPQDLREIYERE